MKEPGEKAATADEAAELGVEAELGSASAALEGNPLHEASSYDASAHETNNADFAHWLAGSLRPSASKSVPPSAPPEGDAPRATPETLAPQVMNSEELDEEDLAVLPLGARRSGSRAWLGKFTVAALGAAAAVFMFGYAWWHDAPEPSSSPSQTAVAATPVGTAGPTAVEAPTLRAPAEAEAKPDDPPARASLGRWIPPMAPAAADSSDTSTGPRGPSVARFPDLPAAVWSYLRQAERKNDEASSTAPGAERAAPIQAE